MSKDKNKPPFLPSPHYEVGYGKPPEGTRFRKGQSGNPKGRPVGAFSRRYSGGEEYLSNALRSRSARLITVREGSTEITVSTAEAAVRLLIVKVLQGSARHMAIYFRMLAKQEQRDREDHERIQETLIQYKYETEIEQDRRDRRGIKNLPELVPHPDHIDIDFDDGSITIDGPMTRKEKAELEARVAEQYRLVDEEEAKWEKVFAEIEATSSDDPRIMSMMEPAREKIAKRIATARATIAAFEARYYLKRS